LIFWFLVSVSENEEDGLLCRIYLSLRVTVEHFVSLTAPFPS